MDEWKEGWMDEWKEGRMKAHLERTKLSVLKPLARAIWMTAWPTYDR